MNQLISKQGFHLLEVLIVTVIIGILTTLVFTSYSQQTIHARRLEAASMLSQLAASLENYHIEHQTYAGATLESLHFPEWIAKNNYHVTLKTNQNTDYLLAAKPENNQISDRLCSTLFLNSDGEKKISGSGNLDDCW